MVENNKQSQQEEIVPSQASRRLQTLQRCFAEVCQGEEPWIALGKFMHQFFGEYSAYREALLADPICTELPSDQSELFKWAVFCAASAEYLSAKYA
jgi:hypothetical protein